MNNLDTGTAEGDLLTVAREPRHPALWLGVAAQLTTLAVLAVAGADWYDRGFDAPWWADFAGAPTALLALAGGFVAAWTPRRNDRAHVEGAPWMRAFWQVLYVTGFSFALAFATFFTDAISWPSVLLISASIGTMFAGLLTLLLVVGPVVVLTDVRRPGVHARWYDVVSAAGIMPWIAIQAVVMTWAVAEPVVRNEYVAMWVGVVLGTVETREAWMVWPVRATTTVFLFMAWRVAVVSRRTISRRVIAVRRTT